MAKKKPPEFQKLWDAYPHEEDSSVVRKDIGGEVDNDNWVNTCAIRLSRALNYAGQEVHAATGLLTVKGADKKRYALRMKELTNYLKTEWGTPQVDVKNPNNSTEKFDGKKGVISFIGIPGYEGGGHIDLWDGAQTAHGAYFESNEVLLWESPPPPEEEAEDDAEEGGSLGATGSDGGAASSGTSAGSTMSGPAGPIVGEDDAGRARVASIPGEPEADAAEDLSVEDHPDADPAAAQDLAAREYFIPPDETISAEYEVLSQPPPADSATATVYRHRVGGDTIETKTLVNQGGSTLELALTNYTAATDSPIFVEYVFEKADAPQPRVAVSRAYSLAEPYPFGLTVPTDAKPGTAFPVEVADWGALAYDLPGQATPFSGLSADRVNQAAKDAVKWRADDADLAETGANPQLTLGEELLGHSVLIEAYVGQPPLGHATARVAVPRLQVRDEDGEHVPPAVVDVGARVTVKGVASPTVAGTWSWETTSDKVTLTPTADTDLCVIEGVTKTEGEEKVTIKAKLTSAGTSNEYEVEFEIGVRELKVEIFFQRSPSYPQGDERGIAALDWRVRNGPADADVYANGTTESDGKVEAQIRGASCFIDLLVSGTAVATYQVTVRDGDYEAIATPIGKQRRLRTLGFHLGDGGPDGNGVDGTMGRRTDRAYLEFQGELGDDMTGVANAHFDSELQDYVGTAPAAAP